MESYNEELQKRIQEGRRYDFQQNSYGVAPTRTLDDPASRRRQQTLDPRHRRPSTTGGATQNLAWDIVPVEGTDSYTIFYPIAIYSRENVTQQVVIINSTFALNTLNVGDFIVATMQGPINTFMQNPTITIQKLSSWTGFPSAYTFGGGPSYAWQASRIPIHKIVGSGDNLFATKLVGPCPTLAYTLATVPSALRTRVVPTLL
jgi:hypothetical protein